MARTKSMLSVLFFVVCSGLATIAAQDSGGPAKVEIAYATKSSAMREPIFVKLIATDLVGNDEWPDVAAAHKGSAQPIPIEAVRLGQHSSSRERWLVVTLGSERREGEEILVNAGAQIGRSVVIEEAKPGDAWASQLFQESNGYELMSALLEHQRITLPASARAKLLAITTSFPNSRPARFANFIIGSDLFLEFERTFNNDGPEGCFASCYGYFKDVIDREDRDPVYAESLRRLAMAKAWSSEYDQAVSHCKELIAANVSKASKEFGEAGLTELVNFREERQREIRDKLDVTER